MKVAVVGAGLAGLAAARTLQQGRFEPVVFEKSATLGGRCATITIEDFIFDSGATSFTPRGRELENVMLHELDTTSLVEVEKPIYTHTRLRVAPGDKARAGSQRYTYKLGNRQLPDMLAKGLDVRLNTAVDEVEVHVGGFQVLGGDFDAVVLTQPTPQVSELLKRSHISRAAAQTYFRPCLSVLLGYRHELPDLPYHALIDVEQRHPLTWLGVETAKCPGRAPEGCTAMVAQLGPQFSAEYFDASEPAIVNSATEYVSRLYGSAFEIPAVSQVVRWQYSQPENVSMFESLNRAGSKLLIAGDGLLGGRTEYAYATGVRAAKMLLEAE